MSYFYYKPLAPSTPTTGNPDFSLPSTVVSSENNPTSTKDSREETPIGGNKPLNSGEPIKILISFKLFVSTKNKKKEKVWIPINSAAEFPMDISIGVTTFENFRQNVASACDHHFPNTQSIILDSLRNPAKSLSWFASIPRCPDWKKSDKICLKNEEDYSDWLDTAYDLGRKEISLNIKMVNPADAKKRALKEDLLAKQEARAAAAKESASKKRKATTSGVDESDTNTGDSESEIDADDFDDINLHMKKIYNTHPVNTVYERSIPIYIDPSNPRRYIPLTTAAVQAWAKDLMDRKCGVDLQSPPKSLKYVLLNASKRIRSEKTAGSESLGLFTEFLGCLQGNIAAQGVGCSDAPPSSPPSESTISAYLEFIGIHNRDHVLDILMANDLTSHKLFRSSGLARKDVMDLGLTLGTVTMLFDNTTKFDKHLAA